MEIIREVFVAVPQNECLSVIILEARKPTQTPEIPRTKRHRVYTNFLEKFAQTFCRLPCDTSQDPNGNCSEIPVQMNFIFWVDFSSGGT